MENQNKSKTDIVFEEIEKNFNNFRYQQSPEFAILMGQQQKIDFKGQLDDNSLKSFQVFYENCQQFLKQLDKLQQNELNQHKVSFKVLKTLLQEYVNNYKYKAFLCPINGFEGPYTNFIDFTGALNFETENDYNNYINLLNNFPQQMQENIDIMQEGLKLQIVSPKVCLEGQVQSIEQLYKNLDIKDSLFFKPFLNYKGNNQDIIKEAQNIIDTKINKILSEFVQFLEQIYIPQCREKFACKYTFGENYIEKGIDMYKALLYTHTTTKYSPEEIYNIGVKEVKRIKDRMVQIMQNQNFQGTDLRDFYTNFLHSNKKYFCKTRDELLQKNKEMCKKIEQKIKEYFVYGIDELIPYEIIPMKSHQEKTAPPAYYLYINNKGYYYVNTYNVEQKATYEIPCLSLHEAIPGHHYQQAVIEKDKNMPQSRVQFEDRKYYQFPGRLPFFTGYLEGWGLYCEYLGEEMGFYEDPIDLFGRLTMEILRACRLVVDTGLHYFDWSYEQAVQYMLQNTCESEQSIRQEVSRYIYWPGQACGYKIGEIKIQELRKIAENQLQHKFDIKQFHQVILTAGPVPLDILEEIILQWIQKQN